MSKKRMYSVHQAMGDYVEGLVYATDEEDLKRVMREIADNWDYRKFFPGIHDPIPGVYVINEWWNPDDPGYEEED